MIFQMQLSHQLLHSWVSSSSSLDTKEGLIEKFWEGMKGIGTHPEGRRGDIISTRPATPPACTPAPHPHIIHNEVIPAPILIIVILPLRGARATISIFLQLILQPCTIIHCP